MDVTYAIARFAQSERLDAESHRFHAALGSQREQCGYCFSNVLNGKNNLVAVVICVLIEGMICTKHDLRSIWLTETDDVEHVADFGEQAFNPLI